VSRIMTDEKDLSLNEGPDGVVTVALEHGKHYQIEFRSKP
jgi:hypothetical protein